MDIINKRIEKQAIQNNIKANKERIEHEYTEGDKIFVKNLRVNKLDPIWNGPYEVVKVDCGSNRLWYDNKSNSLCEVNVKRVRPSFRGEGNVGK